MFYVKPKCKKMPTANRYAVIGATPLTYTQTLMSCLISRTRNHYEAVYVLARMRFPKRDAIKPIIPK